MAKKTGLGRGLGSLISETTLEANTEEMLKGQDATPTTELNIKMIHRNIHQPRTQFDEDELQELADSIKQVGILQPIIVRPDGEEFQIIAGERRYQAAVKAGLKKVPVIIKDVQDKEMLELALIENIQRSNLNSIEEARAYRELMSSTQVTQEELSKMLSKSRSAVANTLRLLELPDEVQDLVFDGKLTAGHARSLLSLRDEEMQIKMAYKIVKEKMSVRQVEESVKRLLEDKPARNKSKKPAEYVSLEKQLSAHFGTKVKLKLGKENAASKIEISFSNEEQLERILNMMNQGVDEG